MQHTIAFLLSLARVPTSTSTKYTRRRPRPAEEAAVRSCARSEADGRIDKYDGPEMPEDAPVTSQPVGGQTVKVEVPKIDVDHLLQGEWKAKHWGCLEDIPTCLLGWCCPCILAWFNAQRLGENPLLYCLGGFFFPMMVPLRFKTREKFGIQSDVLSDAILSGACCGPCSNCQVANELKKRGL